MMSRKETKGSHVVSIAAIKLGSCSQEVIVVRLSIVSTLDPSWDTASDYHFKMS